METLGRVMLYNVPNIVFFNISLFHVPRSSSNWHLVTGKFVCVVFICPGNHGNSLFVACSPDHACHNDCRHLKKNAHIPHVLK